MSRIDELFFETDEKTASNDSRLLELDLLSELVEEYEKEHFEMLDSERNTNDGETADQSAGDMNRRYLDSTYEYPDDIHED